jgi:hypothetical protein
MSTSSPSETPGHVESDAPVFIRGVSHPLPPDERLLWEGAPKAGLIARHVFHRWLVVGYFAIVTGWWVSQTYGTVESDAFLPMLGMRLLLAAIVIGTVEFLARTIANTTVYAITSKRLVLKIGMVLPMSINVPFRIIENAGVGKFRDGSGQIALSLMKGQRLAYVALWPHCKVFSINHPQPVLRGLHEVDRVSAILRDAIVAEAAASGTGEAIVTERASSGTASAVLQPT